MLSILNQVTFDPRTDFESLEHFKREREALVEAIHGGELIIHKEKTALGDIMFEIEALSTIISIRWYLSSRYGAL